MLITILAIVIVLVAWSLHLMQQAVEQREFSLMLAGTLVAFSAAAMVAVYFLMGNYVGYVTRVAVYPYEPVPAELFDWDLPMNSSDNSLTSLGWQPANRLEK